MALVLVGLIALALIQSVVEPQHKKSRNQKQR